MKKTPVMILLTVVFVGILFAPACKRTPPGVVSFKPEKPRPGQPVVIGYRSGGTPLEKAAAVELVAYFYTKGAPRVESRPMVKKESGWEATLISDAKDRGAVLKFQAGEVVDANARKGYILPLYDDRGNLVPGHKAGLAEAIAGWGNILAGLGLNRLQALQMLEEEFAAHPEVKSDYLAVYFTLVSRIRPQDGQQRILKELSQLAAKPGLSSEELALLVNAYTQMQMPELAGRFISALKEKEPKGEYVQIERFQAFAHEPDLKKKLALAEAFQRDFPDSKILGQLHYHILIAFLEAGKHREAKRFLDAHPSDASGTLYMALARGLLSQSPDLTLAEASALQAVSLARRNRESHILPQPPYLTDTEWAEQKAAVLGEALDTLGFIQLRMRQAGPALATLKEATVLLSEKNPTVNEHYAEALLRGASPDETLNELRRILVARHGSSRVKEILKEAYVAHRGSAQGYAEFLAGIEAIARAKLRADLQSRILDEAAPDFSLADLEGNTVSLSGLKGMVVVVDFWASWCEPCLDSFPGMARAVSDFRRDPAVRFLFINSWERVANKRQNIVDFLTAKKYPFKVLLDSQDKVIAAFQVEAIPTQFIIDGHGRIRFRNEGFPGNTDDQVEELAMMIDLVR
jgi:thiol-disulfide isomerase/thioredoxin